MLKTTEKSKKLGSDRARDQQLSLPLEFGDDLANFDHAAAGSSFVAFHPFLLLCGRHSDK
jgi:hypothetical protein